MTSHIEISGLVFEVRRGPRRKSLGLTVDRSGELVVHAPVATLEPELRTWVNGKLLWVHQKLAQKREMVRDVHPPEFVSGESIFYLGRSYRLRIVDEARAPLRFDGEWFELRRSATPKAAQHFQRWFMDKGAAWLRARSAELERLSGQTSTKVIVRDLGYRWGSCGKHRTLYFNWRLLQLPVQVIDYVVLHEQVHLLHHNHSQQFWKALDSVLPDWLVRKEELERDWGRFARFALAATPLETAGGEGIAATSKGSRR
jgi:predicted metal-dependent hydrolase